MIDLKWGRSLQKCFKEGSGQKVVDEILRQREAVTLDQTMYSLVAGLFNIDKDCWCSTTLKESILDFSIYKNIIFVGFCF